MIEPKQIYDASNGGLDIITSYYPAAADAARTKKPFKKRASEDDASAYIKQFNGVWKVTDFGDDTHAKSPIDITMAEEGISFTEAIHLLASRFNVTDELNRSVNKPDIRKEPAPADWKDGETYFELNDDFTDAELKVLGPRVTREHAEHLHWHSVKWIANVKNREVTKKYSTSTYPIFIRECVVTPASNGKEEVKFYKKYEPLNTDKQWRFSYFPSGIKPPTYINGLHEVKVAYREYNKILEKEFFNDPANEDKPFHEQKLPAVYICSGERDSICLCSLAPVGLNSNNAGMHPIWFNSETYDFKEDQYREVMRYCETLYNIPDIDSTGIRRGTDLALRYIDLHTIWLPEKLQQYHDRRGKSRKDFRDYMEIWPEKKNFSNLMNLSMPAKFWVESWNEKKKKTVYDIDTECLNYFLKLNGYYCIQDEDSEQSHFVRLVDHVVKTIKAKDIREFIRSYAEEKGLCRDLRNVIINSPKTSSQALDNLRSIELDFTSFTPTTQTFFFDGSVAIVSAHEIKMLRNKEYDQDCYVWDENIIKHKVKLLDDMFVITSAQDLSGNDQYDIDVKNTDSKFFSYMINASRTYWRKELEENFADRDISEYEEYMKTHHFCIDGDGLDSNEVREQKLHLINKIFVIGYMCHKYKVRSRAWAPMAMDNRIGEEGECNGRSGKSLMFLALSMLMKSVKLSGRNPKLLDNPHIFEQVNRYIDMLRIDDCSQYFNTSLLYDNITDDMNINPKNNKQYIVPFEESPKLVFTTNYVPSDFDPSSDARIIYVVFSDYYHQRTVDNDYRETRSVRDDFDMDLWNSLYSEEDWSRDLNFVLQCERAYLSLVRNNTKIQPPMGNIIKRKYMADMGDNFRDWAEVYFAQESDHLNTKLVREDVAEDYRRAANIGKITMQKFTKKLRAFVALCPYVKELNPEELQNESGRIMSKIDGKTKEMIYIRTWDDPALPENQVKEPEQLNLFEGNEEDSDEPF